jgi:hypothetical protein
MGQNNFLPSNSLRNFVSTGSPCLDRVDVRYIGSGAGFEMGMSLARLDPEKVLGSYPKPWESPVLPLITKPYIPPKFPILDLDLVPKREYDFPSLVPKTPDLGSLSERAWSPEPSYLDLFPKRDPLPVRPMFKPDFTLKREYDFPSFTPKTPKLDFLLKDDPLDFNPGSSL